MKIHVNDAMFQARLCYVDDSWAYFTTQDIAEQWGDDWNDAPYEHNAGSPYTWDEHDAKQGKAEWHIYVLPFQVNLETPSTWALNSPYSVEDINNKAIPWLSSGKYGAKTDSGEPIQIWAGVTLEEFIQLVNLAGGKVYVPFERDE